MSFNPNVATLVGPEWPVTREGVQRVDSDFAVAAATFLSSGAETIDSIGFWPTSVKGGSDTHYEVEIYNEAALDSGAAGFTMYNPTVDASVTPSIYNNVGSGTFFDKVDEGIGTPSSADWLSSGFGSPWPSAYGFRCSGITGSLTGKIVTKVSIQAWAQAATGGTGTPTLTLHPIVQIDGVRYKGPAFSMDSNNPLFFLNHEFPINPITGLSWKIAEVEKFAADADSFVGWDFDPTGSVNFVQRILTAAIRVDWGTTERRVAVGTLGSNIGIGSPAAGTRSLAVLATPAGVDNWAKANATNYLVLVRRRSGTGSIALRWLDSGAACPHAGHGSRTVGFLADGRLDPFQVVTSSKLTPAFDLSMATTAPAGSPDTQPYGSVNGDGGTGETFFGPPLTDVYNVGTQQQEFTPTVAGNYQSIQVLVRGKSNLLPPDGDLQIKVKRRSDNVQLGGTLNIAPGMLVPPYNTWRVFRANISAAALVNGIQYYFDIVAINATAERAWNVQVLSGMESNATYDQYGFGGTTDRLTWFTLTDISYADSVISISQAITNVTGFAAAAQNLILVSPSGWSEAMTTMQKVHLSWTKTSLGGSFLRYEIDRLNPYTALWENIARITNENTQAYDDLECRVGMLGSYRIRTIHTKGAASDWSSTATATPVWGSFEAGLLFVSNEMPGLACGFPTQGPESPFHFLDADTIQVRAMQGRNYQVAFRDAEKRGVTFDRTLYINQGATPAVKGEVMFQAVRDISTARTSYTCVKNKDGEVWYASVAVKDGVREGPDNYYYADVTVLQTNDVPSVVDV